jgi:hypothetical protein
MITVKAGIIMTAHIGTARAWSCAAGFDEREKSRRI